MLLDKRDNIKRAASLDTATLSDALDKCGVAGQCLGIKSLDRGFRLMGRAYTLEYGPARVGGTVGDYIDDIPSGFVAVLSNAGREDATVWGDILTYVAHRRGVAGTVIDGACRDIHLALELGYSIFCRSYSMRTGKDRVQLNARNTVVNIGGAQVAPGDLIIGDSDGVITIPRGKEDSVLEIAEHIAEVENRIRSAVTAGATLEEARRQSGYHQLQRRTEQ